MVARAYRPAELVCMQPVHKDDRPGESSEQPWNQPGRHPITRKVAVDRSPRNQSAPVNGDVAPSSYIVGKSHD